LPARLEVNVTLPLPRFRLQVEIATDARASGLFGHSGAGKSTLLEVIAGLRGGAQGRVAFDGEVWMDSAAGIERPPEQRGVGYMPQDGLLFPHWSARRNILAGATRARADGSSPEAGHVIEILDLEELLPRPAGALSGGERQRVALARALCSGPKLLLLDEPLGSIQTSLRRRILSYLLRAREAFNIPAIYVSHDATDVSLLCDAVNVIREGRIVASGSPPAVFTEPAILEDLLDGDYVNVLEGIVTEASDSRATVDLGGGLTLTIADAPDAARGSRALVGVKAADLMLAAGETPGLSARNILPGTILRTERSGPRVIARISLGGRFEIVALVTEPARVALGLRPGREIQVLAKAQSLRLLAMR